MRVNKNNCYVSIIMNCYNGEKYLRHALDSVISQTYKNWEIIFWDNKSTDGSADIFNSYDDPRFRYFQAPRHTNLGEARNLAVEKAKGEWCAFLDCDDLWLPKKLAFQTDVILNEDSRLGLVYGKSCNLIEGGNATQWGRAMQLKKYDEFNTDLPEGYIFRELLRKNFIPMLTGMVRRSAFWSVGGIEPIYKQAEDYDLFLKISKEFKVRSVQQVVGKYRVHDLNLSHRQVYENHRESISIVSKYLPNSDAKTGLRYHHTYLAVHEIRNGEILKGAYRILTRGSKILLASKAITLLCKFIFNFSVRKKSEYS